MNNFYASVECFLNPKLNTRPIAVCGETEDRHGIVLAKNYKAKGYGVAAVGVAGAVGKAAWNHKDDIVKAAKVAVKIVKK